MAFEKTIKDFLALYDNLTEEACHKEFLSLKLQSQKNKEKNTYPAEAGQLPCNKKKNRFKDILPFEYTRVTLHPIEGVEGSDYINANYITGTGDDVTYIAAQGPLPNTVCDFWRMLWYHSIEIVVMACREVENAKPKCECYWPDKSSTKDFGGISVTTTSEVNKSNDFIVRDFLVECAGEKQYIRQYHYNAWPDHGKPTSSEPIIRMLEMVHGHRKSTDIPLVFHCSAGCGRTGTMIAIDIARTMFLTKALPDSFSVHSMVEKMRQQRPSMVQAKEQYQFVFDAVAELAKRALGCKPSLPSKPATTTKVAVEGNSDGVYMNTAPSPIPANSSPGSNLQEETDDRTRAMYINTPVPTYIESDSGSATSTPAPSPPTKRPVARQRSTSSKSSEQSLDPMYENVNATASEPPQPPPKPTGGTSPVPSPKPRKRTLRKPKPKIPPPATSPKPAKAQQLDVDPPSPKKPLPPPPAHKPKREDKSPPAPPPKTSTPVKATKEKERISPPQDENPYRSVDMTQITDTGPGIEVLDETTGKRISLGKAEQQIEKMEQSGMMDVSTSSSIMDTLLSLVGNDVINEVESKEEEERLPTPPPPPPPIGQRTMSMRDEQPPAIPTRTEASYCLVEESEEVIPASYDMVRAQEEDVGGAFDYEMVPSGNPAPKDTAGAVYEAPTPLSRPMDSTLPPPLPADRPTKAHSNPSTLLSPPAAQPGSTVTLPSPVGSSGSKSPGPYRATSARVTDKISKLFSKLPGNKTEKKKPLCDISGPVGRSNGMPRSPSADVSSSNSSSRPSPSHSTSSTKITFPGELGFGIRIGKPCGPRQEPSGWKVRTLTNSVA